jgi:hypothetical protein
LLERFWYPFKTADADKAQSHTLSEGATGKSLQALAEQTEGSFADVAG